MAKWYDLDALEAVEAELLQYASSIGMRTDNYLAIPDNIPSSELNRTFYAKNYKNSSDMISEIKSYIAQTPEKYRGHDVYGNEIDACVIGINSFAEADDNNNIMVSLGY